MIFGLCNNDITKLDMVKQITLQDSLDFVAYTGDIEAMKERAYKKQMQNRGI